MMKWLIRRSLLDQRSKEPTWYYLSKNGEWTPQLSKAASFAPLAKAEEIARHFSGDAQVIMREDL